MNPPHPNPVPNNVYRGLLGSEGSRFDNHDQRTTDIHYTNYYPILPVPHGQLQLPRKLRQRTSAIAQGLSFSSPEERVHFVMGLVDGFQWPVNEVWVPAMYFLWWTDFFNRGPSQPGPFPPWPFPGLYEPVAMAWTGGQWRSGYCIRWFHETVEWVYRGGPGGVRIPTYIFYHEHKKRGKDEHHVDLPMIPYGKAKRIENLCFGTQIQIYRRCY